MILNRIRQLLTPAFRLSLIRWLAGDDIGLIVNARIWWDSPRKALKCNGKLVRAFHIQNSDVYVAGKKQADVL